MLIYVSRKKQIVETTDGFRMKTFRSFIRREECGEKRYAEFHKDTAFSCILNIRIHIENMFFGSKQVQRIPRLEKGIQKFLLSFHKRGLLWFDCYAFVSVVHNVPIHRVEHLHAFWDIEPMQKKPKVGDTLFFLDAERNFFYHAAVYVGYGVCVSVYGGGGDLEFSTLADMQKELRAQDIYIAKPKFRAVISR